MVGTKFTLTVPVTSFDTHPFTFLTVRVYTYELPAGPVAALFRLTVICEAVKVALVTVVIFGPEIEYVVGVPDVAV